jgi:hypothetical protein
MLYKDLITLFIDSVSCAWSITTQYTQDKLINAKAIAFKGTVSPDYDHLKVVLF